jgi:acyl-CoA reductase-like NAD-dependent aldehyde dehydrogenase
MADLGPLISPESKKRVEGLIASAEEEGAIILLDGRGQKPEKYSNGKWVNSFLYQLASNQLLNILYRSAQPLSQT